MVPTEGPTPHWARVVESLRPRVKRIATVRARCGGRSRDWSRDVQPCGPERRANRGAPYSARCARQHRSHDPPRHHVTGRSGGPQEASGTASSSARARVEKGEAMTKEERDALIASARKTPWLDTMKRRETEALLEALDDAEKRVRDIEDLRARIVSAMSCEPDDDSDLVEAVRENVRERDDAERERDAARAQLAALRGALDRLLHATWVVLCEYGTAGVPMLVRMATAADSARPVLADTEVAAREHDARARAPVEAERDTLAAALAEVMTPRGIYDAWSLNRVLRRLADAADHLLNDHSCDRHGYEGVVCARDAARDHAAAIEKLSIPADLAAQRETRIRADERAKALREAADALDAMKRELDEARRQAAKARVGYEAVVASTLGQLADAERDLDEARAQLAALHAAASAVQTRARALPVSMTEIVHAEEWDDLDRTIADAAPTAAKHKRRVRAKVIAEVLGLYDGTNGCAAADLTPVIEAAQSLETRIRADERVRAR